jgi:hypothetical protein
MADHRHVRPDLALHVVDAETDLPADPLGAAAQRRAPSTELRIQRSDDGRIDLVDRPHF